MENELPEICKECHEKETCNNDPIMWNCVNDPNYNPLIN